MISVNIHVQTNSRVRAESLPDMPYLSIFEDEGSSATIFLHSQAAIDGLISALREFEHEAPFHLSYRHGCNACERLAGRTANRLAVIMDAPTESELRALAGDR